MQHTHGALTAADLRTSIITLKQLVSGFFLVVLGAGAFLPEAGRWESSRPCRKLRVVKQMHGALTVADLQTSVIPLKQLLSGFFLVVFGAGAFCLRLAAGRRHSPAVTNYFCDLAS